MNTFAERSLLELVDFIVDNRGRTCPTAGAGLPLIATNCLKEGKREPVFENVRYVDDATYSNWFRAHPEPGDVLFVCKGSPGRVAVVPDPVPFCIAQDMVALRADRDVAHPGYLYYRLLAPDVRSQIGNMHVGTMIPHFKKGDFGKLRFRVHSGVGDQQAIAEVLSALDDKIAANDQMIRHVDNLAQLYWRSVIVDGDVAPLSMLAKFVNGRAFTKGASGTGRVVVRIAELNSGLTNSTVYSDIDVPDEHTARPGDLLFAWSGSLTVARWYRDEAIVNQHIFKVIPKPQYPMWLVNQAVRSKLEDYRSIASDKATTMGHIQRRHLDESTPIPSEDAIRGLDPLMTALWDRALAAERENLVFATTRDELLPLLMSDRLRVRDAEDVVSEMV